MAKLILGLAGEMGSGKGAMTKYLVEKHGANSHRFSNILRDILDRANIEQTRENITAISVALRNAFGEDVLAKAMCHDALEDDADIIVVDGVRRVDEISYLREIPFFKFIYIEAGIENRYARIINRDDNVGEKNKTLEEFKQAHDYETEKTIPGLKTHADFVIENNGTYEELYAQIDEIISQSTDLVSSLARN